MKLPHLTTSLHEEYWWISWANVHSPGGYLGQMCNFVVDILGKCAISWWISWANVQFHGGYLGQMCIITVNKVVLLLINYITEAITRLVDIQSFIE
jgi:hypothetical protein